MFYVYNRGGGCDGVRLAQSMGVRAIYPYGDSGGIVVTMGTMQSLVQEGKIVNYGCDHLRGYIPECALNFNARVAYSKAESFKIWDSFGLPHPKLVSPKSFGGEFIARVDNLSRGRGMRVFTSDSYDGDSKWDFFVELLPFGREYRLHVAGGGVILTANKVIPEGFMGVSRSHRNGCRIVPGAIDRMPDCVETFAIDAVSSLGLDFGAVDVMETTDGTPYLLEVNTAPGLDDRRTFVAYSSYFTSYLFNR